MRVAILADYLEERWPSMDLVAEQLVECLRSGYAGAIELELVRPSFRRRLSRGRIGIGDRLLNRFVDYPREAQSLAGRFDVYHVIDHSYAHLARTLPGGRTLVTCHDVDAFDAPWVQRPIARRLLDGIRRAAHVACDTRATQDALVRTAGVPLERTTVIHNGVDPVFSRSADAVADAEARRLLAAPDGTIDLLHVGSTIPRKRIDHLLAVTASLRRSRPMVRLVRVGGALTSSQSRAAAEQGLAGAILSLPFLEPTTLAAVYRHSALLLLPSEREGFGLPVLESLACGTPVVASDLPALREVGGAAVTYCAPGDVAAWAGTVERLLDERLARPGAWANRIDRGLAQAGGFSWDAYGASVVALYRRIAAGTQGGC